MELILNIAIHGGLFIGVLVYLTRMYLKKVAEITTVYDRCHITPDHPILPEVHIMQFAPVPITLHGKTMLMPPLSSEGLALYSKRMITFMTKWQQQIGSIRFALLKDLISNENKSEVLKDWSSVQYNENLLKEMQDLLYVVFLKDKHNNPQKITRKWMWKNWTWTDTLQVWQMMWLIQTKSVEDFIEYLLIESQGGSAKQKTGSPFMKLQGTQSNRSVNGLLMPRYSSAKEHPSETKESQTSMISNEVRING